MVSCDCCGRRRCNTGWQGRRRRRAWSSRKQCCRCCCWDRRRRPGHWRQWWRGCCRRAQVGAACPAHARSWGLAECVHAAQRGAQRILRDGPRSWSKHRHSRRAHSRVSFFELQRERLENEACLRTRACIMPACCIAMPQECQLLLLLLQASQCPSPAAGNCRVPSCHVQTCQPAPAHGRQYTHTNTAVHTHTHKHSKHLCACTKHARSQVSKHPTVLHVQYFEANARPHISTHTPTAANSAPGTSAAAPPACWSAAAVAVWAWCGGVAPPLSGRSWLRC